MSEGFCVGFEHKMVHLISHAGYLYRPEMRAIQVPKAHHAIFLYPASCEGSVEVPTLLG